MSPGVYVCTRTWFLGEQVVHIGDPDAVRMIFNAEHDLVESKPIIFCTDADTSKLWHVIMFHLTIGIVDTSCDCYIDDHKVRQYHQMTTQIAPVTRQGTVGPRGLKIRVLVNHHLPLLQIVSSLSCMHKPWQQKRL